MKAHNSKTTANSRATMSDPFGYVFLYAENSPPLIPHSDAISVNIRGRQANLLRIIKNAVSAPSVNQLFIFECNDMNDEAMALIKEAENIELLYISGKFGSITQEGMSGLQHITKLCIRTDKESLIPARTPIPVFKDMVSLKNLEIDICDRKTLSRIQDAKNLESINANICTYATDEDLIQLGNAKNVWKLLLTVLKTNNCSMDIIRAIAAQLKNLILISIDGVEPDTIPGFELESTDYKFHGCFIK